MSWAFITAIKQNPRQSYVELLNSVRDVLQSKYSQKPQLSCSHPLGEFFSLGPTLCAEVRGHDLLTSPRADTNLLFIM